MSPQADKDRSQHGTGQSGRKAAEEFAKLSIEEALKKLGSSDEGLSQEEAKQRLNRYGRNELAEERRSPLLQFLSYFRGTIPYMITAAAIVSGVLGNYTTLGIILALLVGNAIIGFREERQAGNAIDALKKRLAVQARVKRAGEWAQIEARDLVPGDIVRLRIGNVIPADAKLLDGEAVKVDESALTGESLPVDHEAGDTVYSGSILKQGEIDALVYGTGANTFYGKTAQLVESAKTKSHLQIAIVKMANYLLLVGIARGDPVRARPPGGVGACCYAGRAVHHHGPGRRQARAEEGRGHQALRRRGGGRGRCSLLRQDRYPHQISTDPGGSLHGGRSGPPRDHTERRIGLP
jgi:H+-transporting ATPase